MNGVQTLFPRLVKGESLSMNLCADREIISKTNRFLKGADSRLSTFLKLPLFLFTIIFGENARLICYNSGYGIYVKTNSYNNIVVNNTIIGNGNGIGLLDNSNENAIKSNFLRGNILEKNQVHEDKDSLFNQIENNTSVIK